MSKVAVNRYIAVAPLAYAGIDTGSFTYHSDLDIKTGQIVEVPFGKRQIIGVVTAMDVKKPAFETRPIRGVVNQTPLPQHLVDLAAWIEAYYYSSPKSVWQTLLPAGIKRKRRSEFTHSAVELPQQNQKLSDEQQQAFARITTSNSTGFLIQGVTGSGKTRLYIELAADQIKAGRSVIVLVPEIALTPQLIGHFEAAFPGLVLPYHSGMSEQQKHLSWQKALETSSPLVVVGPRSALFLPLGNPGLIVIDECHETSYKQEQNPRYHAIPAASKLAHLAGAKLVLGSATPGINELYLAEQGRLDLIKMTKRVSDHELPPAQIIDMKDRNQTGKSLISKPLLQALRQTLEAGRQSLLFLNRRGTASSQICNSCGHVNVCPRCMLALTFHADEMKLICHICNFRQTPTAVCTECGQAELRFIGSGTKRIESEIGSLMPGARVLRLDKDSADPKQLPVAYKKLVDQEIDILIGTQMIAKGLDLPNLETVGVVNADLMLHLPDFGAAERTFQLLSQVAGRAGRGDTPGRIFIQTHTPQHPAIKWAATGDYWGFASAELESRKLMGYPPFRYLLKLTISDREADKAKKLADEAFNRLQKTSGIKLLGPAPAFYERAGGKHHWHIIVKSASRSKLVEIAKSMPAAWKTDLDPINLL